jgi:MYXO-CTERM domain-containing protein
MLVAAALAVAFGTASLGFIRLATDDTGDTGLFWANPNVSYSIHQSGSDDITGDAREAAAIRMAFDAWGGVEGSSLTFTEDTSPAITAGPKVAANDGRNLVFFDENNSSGLFGQSSFVVAITPVFFTGSGSIVDADIVFNGRDHAFTADPTAPGQGGRFDVQNIAAHEIGHFVGLDHSPVNSSTMIPFALAGEQRLRSLDGDDRAACFHIYNGGAPVGTVNGRVTFEGGNVGVRGAHVVATDLSSGETRGSTITDGQGNYALAGLLPDTYTVYVEPLDGPTENGNLQRNNIDVDFGTLFAPSSVTVSNGGSQTVDFAVPASSGLNVSGVSPAAVFRGTSTIFVESSGSTSLSGASVQITGPGVTHSATVGSSGRIDVTVAGGTAPGARDIVLTKSGAVCVLPGGLEIADDRPSLSAVVPSNSSVAGGGQVQLAGADFEAGARVVFGDLLVPSTGVVFQNNGSLLVTVPASASPRTVDVKVVNPDGQESIRLGAFTYTGDPSPSSVSPSAGPSTGGATATVNGAQFAQGATVTFGGASATNVSVNGSGTQITCRVPRGTAGQTVNVVVRNPDGSNGTLGNGYSYVGPSISSVSPNAGSTSGGAAVALRGNGYASGARVFFGGVEASGVQLISQFELRATAPAHAAGTVNVQVTNTDGETATRQNGFTYVNAQQPAVSSLSPNSGSTAGGQTVVILGSGFESGATVRFGSRLAAGVVVESGSRLTAEVPSGNAGRVDVTVRNPSGLEASLFSGFSYVAAGDSSGGGGGGIGCSVGPAGARPFMSVIWLLAGLALARWRRRRD